MSGSIKILEGVEKFVWDKVSVYVCGPAKPKGAMIVLQEWWGVTDEIQRQALYLSSKGYRCIIPDLYRGKVGVDAEEAQHLMEGLDFPQAVDEIGRVAKEAKESQHLKVGVMGFCMGGALSVCAAVRLPKTIDCAIPFYGVPDKKYFDPAEITIPTQCHFGENDTLKGFSDPSAAEELESSLKESKAKFEFYRYKGVGHAFMNGMVPEWRSKKTELGFGEHRQDQVDLAWSRVEAFANAHLTQ